MKAGIIDLDPTQNLLNYSYSTGNRIVKQEAVNAFTGQTDIQFDGLLDYLSRVLSQSP
jgi:hypothetical protein